MNPDWFERSGQISFGSVDWRTSEENLDCRMMDRGTHWKEQIGHYCHVQGWKDRTWTVWLRWIRFNSIKMANCLPFTNYLIYSPLASRRQSEFHSAIFLHNALDSVEKLSAFVFVSVPRNVSLAASASIIKTQSPAQFPLMWHRTQIQNVTMFFKQDANIDHLAVGVFQCLLYTDLKSAI